VSGRKPRNEELELWAKVAQSARAIPKSEGLPEFVAVPKPRAAPTPDTAPRGREVTFKLTGRADKMAHDLAPEISNRFAGQKRTIDKKVARNMRRGKLTPDGRIDLHGMTQARAHTALTRFILSAQASNKRLLLVITGKGKDRDEDGPIPVRQGVLRHQVPEWLRLPPLSTAVQNITPAHISHGGTGAYYVYLRRAR
jgi:DNA-nicking Smr family endonuclease